MEAAVPDNPEFEDRPVAYEPPCIERVLTPGEMEREMMFAGPAITLGDTLGA